MNGIALIRIEKVIPDLTALAVLAISGCSFTLSFFNLQKAAQEAGISELLSWLWPICIDVLLLSGSLMILRSSLRSEPAYVGWAVLLSFTAVSTGFNVLHSPNSLVSRLAHAVPPLALCISIELLMMCIRSDLMTRGDVAPCTPEPAMMKNECIPPAPKEHEVTTPDQDEQAPVQMSTRDLIITHFNLNPGCNMSQAARALGLSRSTVSRHMKALSLSGMAQE